VDPDTVAAALWIAFVTALVVGVAGVVRGGSYGLLVAALASAVLFAFSFLAGFSIGPFTVAIGLAITALAVTRGTAWRAQALAVAAVLYVLLIWVLPRIGQNALMSVAGGIVAIAILCGMAYVVAAWVRLPGAGSSGLDADSR
jgi:hypothetical protein